MKNKIFIELASQKLIEIVVQIFRIGWLVDTEADLFFLRNLILRKCSLNLLALSVLVHYTFILYTTTPWDWMSKLFGG